MQTEDKTAKHIKQKKKKNNKKKQERPAAWLGEHRDQSDQLSTQNSNDHASQRSMNGSNQCQTNKVIRRSAIFTLNEMIGEDGGKDIHFPDDLLAKSKLFLRSVVDCQKKKNKLKRNECE